ncbi:MAG: DNA polymerase domain-containing protein, partial [Rudaea sp.]
RPQSLHRYPNGIEGKSFFQKDVETHPPWVNTIPIEESGGDLVHYVLCQDESTLLYLANLGCIELNPWNSRVSALDAPDYFVIDLDPLDIGFSAVIETARAVRRVLDRAGAPSFPKTSGATGLHVYVPLAAQYATEQVVQFAKIVAHLVHQQLPEITSIERSPERRNKCVYVDYLQNRRGQTLASAYSLRPRPGAPVSTPLKWSEVKKGLDPKDHNMRTIFRRLDRFGDLWRPVLGPGIDLEACLDRLGAAQES